MLISYKLPSMQLITNHHVFVLTRSFKTAPRSQNAHAYVTAAFSAKVASPSSDLTVEERPFLAYGGISGGFVRASNTERFLVGKKLDDPQGNLK